MKLLARNPEEFAAEFNNTVASDYWRITTADVRLMVECGLIKRYGYFSQADIVIILGVLNYERLKEKKEHQAELAAIEEQTCKICGTVLPEPQEVRLGRPKEYCLACEPLRAKMRKRRYIHSFSHRN